MSKILAIPLVLAATSCSPPADTIQLPCGGKLPVFALRGPSRALSDLEAEGLAFAKSNPAAPQVAFARAHDNWLAFKAGYRPGDQIRASMTRGFKDRMHTSGYALSRDGCVVTNFVLTITD